MSESDREERIRQRAHQRYEERGSSEGDDIADLMAEEEELFHTTGPSHPDKDQPDVPEKDDAQTPPKTAEEKIDEALKESFPASDAPAWRGGTSSAA